MVIVYAPGAGTILLPAKPRLHGAWQQEENRPFPRLTWKLSALLSFPRDLGEYFQSNFAFRRNLIRWHTKLLGNAVTKGSSQRVLEGRQGWLFLGDQGTIADYRGMLPFTSQQLRHWQQSLESRRDWLDRQGIPYLFVVCPDKHTIYPEYMPARINRVRTQTRLDQFLRHMEVHSKVQILDLRPALREMKKTHLCYQPQETHWNGVGAFAGSQEIARQLRTRFGNLPTLTMDQCEIYQQENAETDLLRLLGRTQVRTMMDNVRPRHGLAAQVQWDTDRPHGRGCVLIRSRCRTAPIGRALVVCDSFATHMIPFLAELFREALYVWSGSDNFLPADVLDLGPDVVIQEIVERALCEMTPNLPEMPPVPADAPPAPVPGRENRRTPRQLRPPGLDGA
ncbi:MAG: hypothetical protein FJ280_28945 [Planctomycetes bacterium]|nr:hypothetical protein [Planctomycetota bacterium]